MPYSSDEFKQARSAVDTALTFDALWGELSRAVKAAAGEQDKVKRGLSRLAAAAAVRELLRVSRQANILVYGVLGGVLAEDSRTAQLAISEQMRAGLVGPEVPRRDNGLEPTRLALADAGVSLTDHYLGEILARLKALRIDLLTHSDPPMEPAPQSGRRTVIFTHGDFNESQRFAHWTTHYLYEWLEEWLLLFEATAVDQATMGECLGLAALIMKKHHQAGALSCGISTYWKWDTLSARGKIIEASRLLTKGEGAYGTPSDYFTLTSTWASISSNKTPYRRGAERIADSWLKNDGWVDWMLVEFPNTPILT